MAAADLSNTVQHGNSTTRRARKGEPRSFFDEMMEVDTDDCIIWPYAKLSAGYGKISGSLVHRLACEKANGPPPSKEYEAAHIPRCHNPSCFNKKHVYWASPAQNQMDRVANGTSNRGGRYRNSKLKQDDVRRIRSLIASGFRHDDIAAEYNIARTVITRIGNRTRWGWVE